MPKTIAVIGPNANRCLLGGYSGTPGVEVTMLEGIKAKAGPHVKVLYSEGCKIMQPGVWQQDEVFASDPAEDRKAIAEAVKVARSVFPTALFSFQASCRFSCGVRFSNTDGV